jgi:hypothetical protein
MPDVPLPDHLLDAITEALTASGRHALATEVAILRQIDRFRSAPVRDWTPFSRLACDPVDDRAAGVLSALEVRLEQRWREHDLSLSGEQLFAGLAGVEATVITAGAAEQHGYLSHSRAVSVALAAAFVATALRDRIP